MNNNKIKKTIKKMKEEKKENLLKELLEFVFEKDLDINNEEE